MTLFIASTFADSVKKFKQRIPKGRVLFIANPSDPFKGRKYWIEKDRKAFVDNGYNVRDCDLRKTMVSEFVRLIHSHEILHICGGSAVYILKLLKEKGYHIIITNAIKQGLIYTGTSAGSMIMSPNISFCADDEDEQEVGMVGKLKDLSGLNLIPYYLMCHSQDKYYVPSTKKAMERLPKNKLPILFLRDGQAVWHEDGKMEIV